MRRIAFLILAWLALALSACAQPGAQTGAPNPALWRISDADSEIWLFGTVHVLPPALEWRSARLDAAFAAADTLVLETDVTGDALTRLQALFMERGFDRTGEPLAERLAPGDRARFERVARSLGLSPAAMAPMRPWFAAVQLTARFVQARGQDSESGVESVLGAEAGARGMRRVFLETAEQQIEALAGLAPDVERDFLAVTLRQIEEDNSNLEAMDAAWVRGDTRELARLLNEAVDEGPPQMRRAVLTDRNARWVVQIEEMLSGRGRIFIAVGAAHLVGDESVIAMLRARGIEVDGP